MEEGFIEVEREGKFIVFHPFFYGGLGLIFQSLFLPFLLASVAKLNPFSALALFRPSFYHSISQSGGNLT